MSKPTKMRYYKLSKTSSVFYDTKSKMKVTAGVPSRTLLVTDKISSSVRSGHLIEISESEYKLAISNLPELTKNAIEKEQNLHAPYTKDTKVETKKEVDDELEVDEEVEEAGDEEVEEDQEEREKLLAELRDVTSRSTYKKESKKSNEEIKAFLKNNE